MSDVILYAAIIERDRLKDATAGGTTALDYSQPTPGGYPYVSGAGADGAGEFVQHKHTDLKYAVVVGDAELIVTLLFVQACQTFRYKCGDQEAVQAATVVAADHHLGQVAHTW